MKPTAWKASATRPGRSLNLLKMEVISELQYRDLSQNTGRCLHASMGEALKTLLEEVNLEQLNQDLQNQSVNLEGQAQKKP